jgi:competence protein ComEA
MGEKELIPPEYRLPLTLVGISIIALAFAIILLVKTIKHSEPITFSSDTNISSESAKLTVDVSGAVVKPGVYTLPFGSRVIDAITIAGGVTSQANTEVIAASINQASILSDGAKVYIPIQGKIDQQTSVSHEAVLSSVTISVNTASIEELETLTGVGPVTAKKIIDNRPYTSLEDLVTKKVFGPSLFDKLKNQLTL